MVSMSSNYVCPNCGYEDRQSYDDFLDCTSSFVLRFCKECGFVWKSYFSILDACDAPEVLDTLAEELNRRLAMVVALARESGTEGLLPDRTIAGSPDPDS